MTFNVSSSPAIAKDFIHPLNLIASQYANSTACKMLSSRLPLFFSPLVSWLAMGQRTDGVVAW